MKKIWFLVKSLGKRLNYTLFYTILLFTSASLFSFEPQRDLTERSDSYECKRVLRYFDSLNENTSVEEMVDFLVSLKTSLVAKGYHPRNLTELSIYFKEKFLEHGIELQEREFEKIYHLIERKEATTHPYNFQRASSKSFAYKIKRANDRDDKENEPKIPPKVVVGLFKCMAGGLLCVVPTPFAQTVGTGLILNGISDCINATSERFEIHAMQRKKEEKIKID